MVHEDLKICVVGLGYVGIPVAVNLGRHFEVIGYDINPEKVSRLNRGEDPTLSVSREELRNSRVVWTSDESMLASCNVYVVTVPTPIDSSKNPDLGPLKAASTTIGRYLNRGDLVIYESTVYPGCTEEVCVPLLEKESGLKFCEDFHVGYSPERLNPGDKVHTFENVVKVVSGCCDSAVSLMKQVYGSVVKAGIYVAPSIKTAEMAKLAENVQRDINIALINELAVLSDGLGINVYDVLDAASTKWNFHRYVPGMVGGHCIAVDPYYLLYVARKLNTESPLIIAARKVNEYMPFFFAWKTLQLLARSGRGVSACSARVLILGVTFKENVNDVRNSQVFKLIDALVEVGVKVDAIDPVVTMEDIRAEVGAVNFRFMRFMSEVNGIYDAVIVSVPHDEIKKLSADFFRRVFGGGKGVIIDIKGVFRHHSWISEFTYWTP